MLQISNGSVEVEASIMGAQQDGKKVKVPLNSRYQSLVYIFISRKMSALRMAMVKKPVSIKTFSNSCASRFSLILLET